MGDEFEVTPIFRRALPNGELFGDVIGVFVPDFFKKPGKAIDNGFAAEANPFAFGGKSDHGGVRVAVTADEFDGFMGGDDVGVSYFCDFVESVVEIVLCHAILLVVLVLKVIQLYQFWRLSWSFCDGIRARFPGLWGVWCCGSSGCRRHAHSVCGTR